MNRKMKILGLLLICLLIIGCGASFKVATYKTLDSARISYDNAMRASADAYKLNLITEAQKTDIILYGNKFYVSYLDAVDTLEEYIKGTSDKIAVEDKISVMSEKLGDLLLKTSSYGLEVK